MAEPLWMRHVEPASALLLAHFLPPSELPRFDCKERPRTGASGVGSAACKTAGESRLRAKGDCVSQPRARVAVGSLTKAGRLARLRELQRPSARAELAAAVERLLVEHGAKRGR
jgi:hypothetical protein